MITETTRQRLSRLLTLSRWVFGPVALGFVVLAAMASREAFSSVLSRASFPFLVTAVAIWSLLHLLSAAFSWTVLRELGTNVPYRVAMAIHVGRLPARYLPGGIWHTVSRVADLNRHGVSSPQLAAMVVMENLVSPAVALLLGSLCAAWAGSPDAVVAVAAALGFGLLGAAPLVLRHRFLVGASGFGAGGFVRLLAISIAFWIVAASAFACYWSAFPAPFPPVELAKVVGAYLLAWAAGFLMVFAPQGIGVFEASIAALLGGALPFAGAVVLAAGFRAAVLAADFLAFAGLQLARLFSHILRQRQRQD